MDIGDAAAAVDAVAAITTTLASQRLSVLDSVVASDCYCFHGRYRSSSSKMTVVLIMSRNTLHVDLPGDIFLVFHTKPWPAGSVHAHDVATCR